MKVVSVLFTLVLIGLVVWLVVDTIKLFIRKYKERKANNNKTTDVDKKEE